MITNETIEIKRYLKEYLIIVVGLTILEVLLREFLPDIFVETIVKEGFRETKSTFLGIYGSNIFNIIVGLVMAFDLYKIGRNWIVIPILTTASLTAGLFFFSIVILDSLINSYEQI